MKVLKSIFNFYLNSSIHVALAVYAMTWITLVQFDLPYSKNVLYFIFFASISGYNFVKYFGLAKFHHRSLANWLKIIQVFSAIAFLLMGYYFFQLNSNVWILIVVLGLITFLYAIPLIPKKYLFDDQQNLREVGGAKVYIIALVWSLVTVLIPVLNTYVEISADVFITVLQRFCFVIVLMLPFEIRDLKYDSLKLATIPQKIGTKKTKIIGLLLLLVFLFLEFLKVKNDYSSIISTLIITLLTLMLLVLSSEKQSKYYSAFLVEAIPIVWLLILLLFS
ncbi:hypothetical protein BTO05_06130 [Winogradskyella sp. PC-19]|uniref:hypothetical protein n=1 Tax=Winogradskyella sp. PC-19 TaxID=754417 RepID=UPI000B3CD65D|nr:hypothetical protein [Winogradskyella sp. PC-19]ARV09240.1 hypothetical protein BTO05_06130 [Winogradskyella sp. PC-19]RZN82444.1 MAG: hypothetical protein EVB12_02905 [Winogradskyella sp.]